MENCVEEGILVPAKEISVTDSEKKEYDEGFVFERTPEIITRGHVVNKRVEKVKERAEFSDYPLLPTKFAFAKTVRIYACVFKFLRGFKCLRRRKNIQLTLNPSCSFKIFHISDTESENVKSQCLSVLLNLAGEQQNVTSNTVSSEEEKYLKKENKVNHKVEEKDLNTALYFLFAKATKCTVG